MWQIIFDILQDGQVDWPTKELLILKSTKIGDCLYCVTQHEVVSGRLGVSEEKQAEIVGVEYRNSPNYTEAERAILDLCPLGDPTMPATATIDVATDLAHSLWRTSPHFDDGERAVLELVTQIAEDANAVPDELWDRLRTHWDHGQLLELAAVITTFIMIGRLGDTLGVSEPQLFANPVR